MQLPATRLMLQMLWRLGPLATLWCLVSNRLLVDDVQKGEALIDSIAVHPGSQGRGFGTALLKWCEATVAAEAEPGTRSNLYLWVCTGTAARSGHMLHPAAHHRQARPGCLVSVQPAELPDRRWQRPTQLQTCTPGAGSR